MQFSRISTASRAFLFANSRINPLRRGMESSQSRRRSTIALRIIAGSSGISSISNACRDVARAYSFVVEEPIQLIGKSTDDLFSRCFLLRSESPSGRLFLRRLRRKVARSVCLSPNGKT